MDNLVIDRAYDRAPDVRVMAKEIECAITDASNARIRHARAWDTRRCYWPGQSPDGRKWQKNVGGEIFPFDGSSDMRTWTVEEVINDEVTTLKAAFHRATFQATGLEGQNIEWGGRITQLLKWLYYTKMLRNLSMQVERVAQWRQTFGISVSGIDWDQRIRAEYQSLDMQTIAQMMQASDPSANYMQLDAADMFYGNDRRNEAIEFLKNLSPLVQNNMAAKMLNELRQTGATKFPVPYLLRNQPRRRALRAMVDVFWPVDVDDIQEARWVAEVELVDESELRNRVLTRDNYDPTFVRLAIEKAKGVRVYAGNWANRGLGMYGGIREELDLTRASTAKIELVHFYHKACGDDLVPALHRTVFCPGLSQGTIQPLVACSGIFDYAHGEYPYVVHCREYLTQSLLDSRGSAELAEDAQREIKVQRDARIDLSSLTTMPPLIGPPGKMPRKLELRPAGYVPLQRADDLTVMKYPQMFQGSVEVENATQRGLDQLFGRSTQNVQPDKQANRAQDLVNGWLIEHRLAGSQELMLAQQYLDEVTVTRVIGVVDHPFHLSNDDIRGAFDLQITFDARELNPEYAIEKLKAFSDTLLPLDKFSRIDLGQLVAIGARWIDPQLADSVIQSMDAGGQSEIDQTQSDLMKILSGMDPALKEKGVNWQLRMQVVQQTAHDPTFQQRAQQDPGVLERLKQYVAWLQQGLNQDQNAVIGRFGTLPGRIAA
jgi:hypothetical protein